MKNPNNSQEPPKKVEKIKGNPGNSKKARDNTILYLVNARNSQYQGGPEKRGECRRTGAARTGSRGVGDVGTLVLWIMRQNPAQYLHYCICTVSTQYLHYCIYTVSLVPTYCCFQCPFTVFLVLFSVAFRSLYRFYTFRYFFTTFHNVSLLFTTFTLKGTKIHLRPSCVFRRLGPMPPTPSATTPSYGKNCSVLSL